MCNEFSAVMLYTHIPAFLIALFFCFFIYFANRRSELNRNLALMTLALSFWIGSHIVRSFAESPELRLFLQRIEILAAFFVPFFLYFSYAIARVTLGIKRKLLYLVPFLAILPFVLSNHNIFVSMPGSCMFNRGILYSYALLLSGLYVIRAIFVVLRYYKSLEDDQDEERNQLRIVIVALAFIVGWIAGYLIGIVYFENVGQYEAAMEMTMYMPMGLLLFIWLVFYAITKYRFLKMRALSARILIFVMWILVGSNFLVVDGKEEKLLALITLLLSFLFGVILLWEDEAEYSKSVDLEKVNAKLKDIDEGKSEFISILAHQLRTPLTTTKGFISMMRKGTYGKLSPDMKDAVDRIHSSNERVLRLINDLLNVTRIDSGKLTFEFTQQCLGDVVKEICDSLSPIAKQKKLKLLVSVPRRSSSGMLFDQTKMREALFNIVENAIKYTEKGTVTVTVKRIKGDVRFSVADTGMGIAKNDLERIFRKFSRGCNSRNVCSNGLGLGLYFGKKVVEAHGGTIAVASKGLGMGAVFTVQMPIRTSLNE